MLPVNDFVRKSLELHLFFGRIMKEHSFFLEAGFVSKNSDLVVQAEGFKNEFNMLLIEAVKLADGNVSADVLRSGEVVTDKTFRAEEKTEQLSGIDIDTSLTEREFLLIPGPGDPSLEAAVYQLNSRSIELTNRLIAFKTMVLEGMLSCVLYTYNYPLLIEHIRREARFYVEHITRLQNRTSVDPRQEIIEEKIFWDRIMAEHMSFIIHLLDPTEKNLIKQADSFGVRFNSLEQRALLAERRGRRTLGLLVHDELRATKDIKDFKNTADELILACEIRSIIIPLLADHVLREADHFYNILEQADQRYMR